MSSVLRTFVLAAILCALPAVSDAGVTFTFTESAGDVIMTASGSLDTSLLVSTSVGGWGGTGFEQNGTIDIMGSTFSPIDTGFGFSAGTDLSAWTGSAGPWSSSFFGWDTILGTTPFSTYHSAVTPTGSGISVASADLVGGVWTPDNVWTESGATFASLGLTVGTYTITDITTGEFISIVVVPEPSSYALGLLVLLGIGFRRRLAA